MQKYFHSFRKGRLSIYFSKGAKNYEKNSRTGSCSCTHRWRIRLRSKSIVDAERNAFLGAYTYDSSPLDALENSAVKEVKFWRAEGDVTLAKNVRLHGEYNFDVKTKGTDTDYDDVASVSLNYVF